MMFRLIKNQATRQAMRSMSTWDHIQMAPLDPILGVNEMFNKDPYEGKINVSIGAYRTDDGKPWVLPSVEEAQRRNMDAKMNMEYAPITGVPSFVKQARILALGADSEVLANNRIASCQSLSGTGALRLSGEVLASKAKVQPTILLPNPTWGNHMAIYKDAGLKTQMYRYWHPESKGLDLDGMLEDLKEFKGPAYVLLHACAHNPTGVDPTVEQWKQISDTIHEAGHSVIFDNAYQGFASGSVDKDGEPIRFFVEQGHNITICQSFAKNFGLYGQRTGMYSLVCKDAEEAARMESQIKLVARGAYSSPPIHGARIVSTILEDEGLKQQWFGEIKTMSSRIIDMRALLKEELIKQGSTLNWDHITNQIGMFSYTGLSPEQCDLITEKHHVYLTRNGRISMAGVTTSNVAALAAGIHDVSK